MSWNPFSKFFRKRSDSAKDAQTNPEQKQGMFSKIAENFQRWWVGEKPHSLDHVLAQETVEISNARQQRLGVQRAAAAAAAGDGAEVTHVMIREIAEIDQKRGTDGPNRGGVGLDDTVGISFSGGGIRSATFNLGIIQGLAEEEFLKSVDYLSTVSGGGYIGGWLTAWIKRDGCANVEEAIKKNAKRPPAGQSWRYLEPDPIRFLRNYSNYLAPRAGLISTDTWALMSTYIRNVLLNLTLLVAMGSALLLVPLLSLRWTVYLNDHSRAFLVYAVWIALISVFVALAAIAYSFTAFTPEEPQQKARDKAASTNEVKVKWYVALLAFLKNKTLGSIVARPGWFVVFPLLITSLCLTPLLAEATNASIWTWTIAGALWYGILWIAANNVATAFHAISERDWKKLFTTRGPKPVQASRGWSLFAALSAGALAGLLIYGIKSLLFAIGSPGWLAISDTETHLYYKLAGHIVLGPPLLLVTFTLACILQVGLLGNSFPDAKREWLARLCGMLALVATGYFLFTGIAIYGPVILKFLFISPWAHTMWGRALQFALPAGWITTTAAGVIGGNRSNAKPNGSNGTGLLLKIAPPVFILGLTLLLSTGVDAFLSRNLFASSTRSAITLETLQQMIHETASSGGIADFAERFTRLVKEASPSSVRASLDQVSMQHWQVAAQYLSTTKRGAWYLFMVLCVIARLLSWRLDVNEFSIHLLYRNRLTRCYLGASHADRDPQAFTGFDMNDDVALAELAGHPAQTAASDSGSQQQRRYDGPYPLFCTALNLVSGKDLAWQKRKARSFIYSPLFCGYDYFSTEMAAGKRLGENAYRPTSSFSGKGGPYLGTAMAISGAAASPNMGYHSSPALTFLMGVFNVRLGWWVGNTRHNTAWELPGPRSATYLALELFGRTNDEKRFVYLSDGGHFENLGLYELVRRKCRYIIVSDAGCDPTMTFSDLGNAIEKCRRDLGAEIDIDISRLRPRHGEKLSKVHYAIGTITYKNPDPNAPENPPVASCLLYIKSSLTGREPEDVQAYAAEHSAFPHDSTAEQFFDETRFESYRALGQAIFRTIVKDVQKSKANRIVAGGAMGQGAAIHKFFQELENMRQPVTPPVRTGSIDMEEVPFGKMKLTFEAL